MKKHEIYVPIANKKEAKRAKAVLEAMGEVISTQFWYDNEDVKNQNHLMLNNNGKDWLCFKTENKTEITLKQLIELLVSEQKEPEKIAVRVDNEKEFNAIEKYRVSLGFKKSKGSGDMEFPLSMRIENNWGHTHTKYENIYLKDYKIIPFSEFAKEHGIRVPLLVSEDGVELFEGDLFTCVYNHENVWYKGADNLTLHSENACIINPTKSKAFSTKKSALDWIEAQKPKEVKIRFGNVVATVSKDGVCFNRIVDYIGSSSLKAIHKAMEELNS